MLCSHKPDCDKPECQLHEKLESFFASLLSNEWNQGAQEMWDDIVTLSESVLAYPQLAISGRTNYPREGRYEVQGRVDWKLRNKVALCFLGGGIVADDTQGMGLFRTARLQ